MSQTEYRRVRITMDRGCPKFMGTDLEKYGPFDEGEIVEVPKDNAEILVNRGSAEYTDLDDKSGGENQH